MGAAFRRSEWLVTTAGVTLVCFAGCSLTPPARHVRLALRAPAGADVESTAAGEAVVRWSVGTTRFALSPHGALDDLLNLWIAVQNDGADPVVFQPSRVQYAFCRPDRAARTPPPPPRDHDGAAPLPVRCGRWTPVPDKSTVLARLLERERRRQAADEADATVVAFVMALTFVLLFAVVASAASHSGARRSSTSSRRGSRWPARIVGHAARLTVDAALGPSSSFGAADAWILPLPLLFAVGAALDETVIAPGAYEAGHVFIPPDLGASSLRLRIEAGDDVTTVDFDYRAERPPTEGDARLPRPRGGV